MKNIHSFLHFMGTHCLQNIFNITLNKIAVKRKENDILQISNSIDFSLFF